MGSMEWCRLCRPYERAAACPSAGPDPPPDLSRSHSRSTARVRAWRVRRTPSPTPPPVRRAARGDGRVGATRGGRACGRVSGRASRCSLCVRVLCYAYGLVTLGGVTLGFGLRIVLASSASLAYRACGQVHVSWSAAGIRGFPGRTLYYAIVLLRLSPVRRTPQHAAGAATPTPTSQRLRARRQRVTSAAATRRCICAQVCLQRVMVPEVPSSFERSLGYLQLHSTFVPYCHDGHHPGGQERRFGSQTTPPAEAIARRRSAV